MNRRVEVAILAAGLLGIAGFVLLSWRPVIAAIERPAPESFSAESIARGEALAAAGHCASCHTRPGGPSYAGGYGVNTPFGIVYGTNITPDPKTGIGTWSVGGFCACDARGCLPQWIASFPCVPLQRLHQANGR